MGADRCGVNAVSFISLLHEAVTSDFRDEDGERVFLTLLPGLSEIEIERFAARLPCALAAEMQELPRLV